MGGPGSGRWKKGIPRAENNYPKVKPNSPAAQIAHPPKDSAIGAEQPKGNPEWHPLVGSWWRALGLSDAARIYQPIDWVNAWIAADILDQMYDIGFSAGLYKEWQHTVEWLHAPRLDLLDQPEELPDEVDEEQVESDANFDALQQRLKAV